MIVALEEAKRRLVALEDVLAELKNQLRIDEAKERAEELARESERRSKALRTLAAMNAIAAFSGVYGGKK